MRETDFINLGIKDFSPREVEETGADLRDVNCIAMERLQCFRAHRYVDRPVVLLPNGITSGEHASWQHPSGIAFDVSFYGPIDTLTPKHLLYAAVEVGFKGIGMYYNGTALSLHLDLGPDIRRWLWIKPHRSSTYTKIDLILNPIELQEKGAILWPLSDEN